MRGRGLVLWDGWEKGEDGMLASEWVGGWDGTKVKGRGEVAVTMIDIVILDTRPGGVERPKKRKV